MTDTELAELQVEVERLWQEYIAAKKTLAAKDHEWELAYQTLLVEQRRREFTKGIVRVNPFLVQ